MLGWFLFQNALLVIMAQAAILIVHVRTMEFAMDFLDAVGIAKFPTEGTVNMVNRDNK